MSKRSEMPEGWRERLTMSVADFARVTGVSEKTAYEAVRAGDVPVIKLGARKRVSVPALLKRLEAAE